MSEDYLELERRLLVNLLGPRGPHLSKDVIWKNTTPETRILVVAGEVVHANGTLYSKGYNGPGDRKSGWTIYYKPGDVLWPPVTFEEILKIITDADWRREHGFPKLDDVQDHD